MLVDFPQAMQLGYDGRKSCTEKGYGHGTVRRKSGVGDGNRQ